MEIPAKKLCTSEKLPPFRKAPTIRLRYGFPFSVAAAFFFSNAANPENGLSGFPVVLPLSTGGEGRFSCQISTAGFHVPFALSQQREEQPEPFWRASLCIVLHPLAGVTVCSLSPGPVIFFPVSFWLARPDSGIATGKKSG